MAMLDKLRQLKSGKLWKDCIAIGLAIFGFISAAMGIWLPSLNELLGSPWHAAFATFGIILSCYLIAVIYQWLSIKSSITIKVRGIKVTVRQGNLFDESSGWKVIPVDSTFSTSEDDSVISHGSLHGQFIKLLKDKNNIASFRKRVEDSEVDVMPRLGSAVSYKDYRVSLKTPPRQKV